MHARAIKKAFMISRFQAKNAINAQVLFLAIKRKWIFFLFLCGSRVVHDVDVWSEKLWVTCWKFFKRCCILLNGIILLNIFVFNILGTKFYATKLSIYYFKSKRIIIWIDVVLRVTWYAVHLLNEQVPLFRQMSRVPLWTQISHYCKFTRIL